MSLLLVALDARAQSDTASHRKLRLSWVRSDAAASCPDAGEVQRDVESRLGWSPFVQDNQRSETIEALVTHEGNFWRANIQLRDAEGASLGSRDVTSSARTCDSLAATAALAIALIIEPILPETPATPEPLPPPAPSPPPAPPAAKPTPRGQPELAPNAVQQGPRSSRGGAALGLVAAANVLPHFALGPSLAANVRVFNGLFAHATASFLPEQHARAASADVAFGMTLGSLGACYRWPIAATWNVAGCASVLGGSLDVTVHSPGPIAPGARTWWAGSIGARSAWQVGQAEIAFRIDALDHFARHTYLIGQAAAPATSSVFVEPAFAALAALEAGVRF